MSDDDYQHDLADLLNDPQIAALIGARENLHSAATAMMENAPPGDALARIGSSELPTALSAMQAAEESGFLDEIEDAARWVARTVTVTPTELLADRPGVDAFAFLGAVILVRGALAQLDEAKAMNE